MEEKILYLDLINGISGDMTLATLLDLGVSKEAFLDEMKKLNMSDEFEIIITDKNESGIVGINVVVKAKEIDSHRHLSNVFDIIDSSSLNERIKAMAKDVFTTVAKGEAKVHGTTIEKVHFHEVGAIDSIVDIIGACVLIDMLGVDKIYASSVPVGSGFVKCDHGMMPVPAPATMEILKGVPVKFNTVKGECTTPTGAAIVKTLCDGFVDEFEFEPQQVGYGIGYKKFEVPNMVRGIIGVKKNKI